MIAHGVLQVFALLVFGHVIGDYAFQSDFMAKAKDRTAPLPGIPWYQVLAAHAVIHGGIVGLVTGSLVLAVLETLIHAAIDDAKCQGRFGYNVDQALHIVCKLIWLGLFLWLSPP